MTAPIRGATDRDRPRWNAQRPRSANVLICTPWATEIILVGIGLTVVAMAFFGDVRTWAFTVVHFGAASILVLNIVCAGASHASARLRTEADAPADIPVVSPRFRNIAVGMALGIVVAAVAIPTGVPYAVIIVEV